MTPQSNPEGQAPPPRVTAVVVSRNREALLRKCLQSLENADGRDTLQVVVVDNGSASEIGAAIETDFPRVQLIRLPKNFGLTKALNIGWRAADAEYVLFLHDDTEVEPAVPLALADVLDSHPEASAVAPLLVDEEGQPAPQIGNLPPDGQWRPAQAEGTEPVVIQYPRGAALMVRVYSIKAIRQIDERYGQFGSDADLAAQMLRASKKILLLPTVRVKHIDNRAYSPQECADFLLARAVFLGKYRGFGAGVSARLAAIFGPLLGFRLGELSATLSGQKIDGTQS